MGDSNGLGQDGAVRLSEESVGNESDIDDAIRYPKLKAPPKYRNGAWGWSMMVMVGSGFGALVMAAPV